MLRSASSVLRTAVLSRVQLPVASQGLPALAWGTFRGFGAGSFLEKSEVTDRVIKVVKDFAKVDPSKVTPKAAFQGDLGLDSLDTVEIVMAFEEEFSVEIPDGEADKIQSVADAIEYLSGHPQAK